MSQDVTVSLQTHVSILNGALNKISELEQKNEKLETENEHLKSQLISLHERVRSACALNDAIERDNLCQRKELGQLKKEKAHLLKEVDKYRSLLKSKDDVSQIKLPHLKSLLELGAREFGNLFQLEDSSKRERRQYAEGPGTDPSEGVKPNVKG